jgi:hypothetical protein
LGVKYVGTSKGKEVKFEDVSSLLNAYNSGGSSVMVFPKTSNMKDAEESMLFVTAANMFRDMGHTAAITSRYCMLLGNRGCLGCAPGKKGDVVKGRMYCAGCAHKACGSITDQLMQWISQPHDAWCYNIKPQSLVEMMEM